MYDCFEIIEAAYQHIGGATYCVLVGNNLDIGPDDCGHGFQFRDAEGFMPLGKPDKEFHGKGSGSLSLFNLRCSFVERWSPEQGVVGCELRD